MSSQIPTVSGAVVLLSAGLDSSFNLVQALEKFSVRRALTFNYGQRAAAREIECAQRLAAHYLVEHQVVELPWFKLFSKSALNEVGELPMGDDVKIDNPQRSRETADRVWVPNRNGIFLNIAAGFAEGIGAHVIIPGFNREEAATFPDNSGDFLTALDQSLHYSTQGRVNTFCFSTSLDKTEIVREALKARLNFSMLWPCYLDGQQWCGECESCRRFRRAIEANGLVFTDLQRRPV